MKHRRGRQRREARALFGAASALFCIACDRPPIEWRDDASRLPREEAMQSVGLDASFLPLSAPSPLPRRLDRCEGSIAYAHVAGRQAFAAWWLAQPDSGAALVVQRTTDDGATWSAPEIVDQRDSGHDGCGRPPPAVAADSITGYLLIAYASAPKEGTAVWFAHAMPTVTNGEPTLMWHAPVPVVFGDRLVHTAVAGVADTVVVAYEYPSGPHTQLGLAVSRTAGHLFSERMAVTVAGSAVSEPRVALRTKLVTLVWRATTLTADSTASWMIRAGRLK
ncbi:MAG: glycoside hydrolase [Gemmatimonadota bacterium]|nr:glycoside hydrolase [Gemmatimonadota bacterium]